MKYECRCSTAFKLFNELTNEFRLVNSKKLNDWILFNIQKTDRMCMFV